MIERSSVSSLGHAYRYRKSLYAHYDNLVDITLLWSQNGIDYEPSHRIMSAELKFDSNDNLIQSELFNKGYSGMQDYFEVTDFTYDKDFNLITTNPSFYESCTYSNIKNPLNFLSGKIAMKKM